MQTKILLDENEIPTHWYNVVADMPNAPAPVLGPDGRPIGPDALAAIFPDALIEQEVSAERWIRIPDKAARRKPSSLTCPGTVISRWPPTTNIWPESWRISTILRRPSKRPCITCQNWTWLDDI